MNNSSETTRRFQGRTAVITGAAGGFGLATARLIAEGGGRVVAIDRNESVRAACDSLPRVEAGAHVALVADLRPAEAAPKVIAEARERAGSLDILVNSAGVCHFNKTAGITPEEWDEVHEIDVRALFFLSVAFAEQVDVARGGRIVNLGSNAGRKGRALSAHYAAAKAAVANLTESLALSYGPRQITVNTVCPAVVLTPMWEQNFRELGALTGRTSEQLVALWREQTPLRRLGTVEDVAKLTAFLASDDAAFITGQEINVCGGFMLTC